MFLIRSSRIALPLNLSSLAIQLRTVDELGEIAVMDKADFTLSSDGQLCCLTGLFLLCFSFTSFIFFLFYLGHRHVAGPGAGLGSLTSSLSACARVYGDTRLRSLPMDSGSNRTCLTLEQFTVTWEDGYGHADAYSALLWTCLSSLSAVSWWSVIGTMNKTIRGTRVWVQPGVSSIRSYPRTCLLLIGTDLVRFTGLVVEAKTYICVNDPGLHNAKGTSPQQPRMHSRGWVYMLQHVDTLHFRSLCGSVQYRRTVLVRRLCVPGTLLQHTIEVVRPRTVAGLLDSVSYELTHVTVEVHHPLGLITPRQSPAYTKGSLESLNFLH